MVVMVREIKQRIHAIKEWWVGVGSGVIKTRNKRGSVFELGCGELIGWRGDTLKRESRDIVYVLSNIVFLYNQY